MKVAAQSLLWKFNSQGKLNLLKKNTLPQAEKALLSASLNGKPLEHRSECEQLLAWLDWKITEKQLTDLLFNYYQKHQLPFDKKAGVGQWLVLEEALVGLAYLEEWNSHLQALKQPSFYCFGDSSEAQIQFYDGLVVVKEYRQAIDRLAALSTRIQQSLAHPLL
mgnify:CR=1 FL=1